MTFLQRFSTRFHQTMVRRAAVQVHQHLRLLDAATLSRAGISPDLLAQGPSLYPWREASQAEQLTAQLPANHSVVVMPEDQKAEIRKAIAELSACSDNELHDLGIARSDIKTVVKFGRPGIERPDCDNKVAA